jgi:hypothetical protein
LKVLLSGGNCEEDFDHVVVMANATHSKIDQFVKELKE